MKRVLKFVFYTLLTWTAIFTFWSKVAPVNSVYNYSSIPSFPLQSSQPSQSSQSLPPFPPVHDSLSGSEFLYNNLTWKDWGNSVEIGNTVNAGIYTLRFDAGADPDTKKLSMVK